MDTHRLTYLPTILSQFVGGIQPILGTILSLSQWWGLNVPLLPFQMLASMGSYDIPCCKFPKCSVHYRSLYPQIVTTLLHVTGRYWRSRVKWCPLTSLSSLSSEAASYRCPALHARWEISAPFQVISLLKGSCECSALAVLHAECLQEAT